MRGYEERRGRARKSDKLQRLQANSGATTAGLRKAVCIRIPASCAILTDIL
jgi:hypothetical protein